MSFFSLFSSISPSTAWVCVKALTCKDITCLASVWESRRQSDSRRALPPPPREGRREPHLQLRSSTHHVSLLIVLILNDEDHVKSGQDGGHKIYVLLTLGLIPAPKDRVGSCQNRAA